MRARPRSGWRIIAGLLLAAPLAAPGLAAAQTTTTHRGAPSGDVYPRAAAWCSNFRLGALSAKTRMDAANLQRLRAAQEELAPGFTAGGARTGLDLLAGYQEQLERRHPDIGLASTYLAMVSTVPVTTDALRRVNALLCVSTTRATAAQIAATAEAARLDLAR